MINLFWCIPFSLGLIYFVAMFFINAGEKLSRKFRIIKVEKDYTYWIIQNKFLFIWFHWSSAVSEYWDGKYKTEEDAIEAYDGLVYHTKKTIVKQS